MYSIFPYEDILSEIDKSSPSLRTFPCEKHGGEVILTIVQTYVMLRMRQCCRNVNDKKEKNVQIKKKNGHLV